jgi:hypothetical protein
MVGIEGGGAGIGGVVGLCFWSCRSKEVAKRFSKSHVARARTSLSVTLELGRLGGQPRCARLVRREDILGWGT